MNTQEFSSLQEAYMKVVSNNNELSEMSYKKLPGSNRMVNVADTHSKKTAKAKSKLKMEQVDIYDIILSHLLDEGYAETPEAAEKIMVHMSEEWREGIVEGYVPLRTSDDHHDDEGFPTRTSSWSKKMTNAIIRVGKPKMQSRHGIGDPIGNLTKGVSAKKRLDAMKKVDDEPESKRAQRSQAKAQANQQLGANRRRLQTSLDREHLTRSLNKS